MSCLHLEAPRSLQLLSALAFQVTAACSEPRATPATSPRATSQPAVSSVPEAPGPHPPARTATEQNLRDFDLMAEKVAIRLPDFDLMGQHVGSFVPAGQRSFFIETRDKVLPSPKRIAILIDQAASSGEQFLLAARQSRKVTLFGQRNSRGILDFANVLGMASPSGRFLVEWATSRSMRLPDEPVDEAGIAPDVVIPPGETDPVTYAQRWLERQVD